MIVGVDGSSVSAAALGWAADEARLRGSELMVVTAGIEASNTLGSKERCRDVQVRMLRILPAGVMPPRWTSQVLRGDPVETLTRLATAEDILVAGTRGRGRLCSLLLGSVAQGCVERAPCPVVIVPAGQAAVAAGRTRRPVVVGIDSSPAARRALRFAAEEAVMRAVPLTAVHAVYPDYVRQNDRSAAGGTGDWDLLGPFDSVRAQLDALLRDGPRTGGIAATPVVVCGHPERVLLQWTRSAALVVVGSRGEGRFHTALIGSVSMYLLRHSHCPVAVVPAVLPTDRNPMG